MVMQTATGVFVLLLSAVAPAAGTGLENGEAKAVPVANEDGYTIYVDNAVGSAEDEVRIPMLLYRGTAVGNSGPSAISGSFSFDPEVLEFLRLEQSEELLTWYNKQLFENQVAAGQLNIILTIAWFQGPMTMVTTFDDQRPGGNPSSQINPFPLGELVFRTKGESGTVSSLSFADVVMVDNAMPTPLNVVSYTQDASFRVGGDSDGDGMSDEFESTHDLDPLDPEDAGLDADGDGATNLEEFLLGTNPRLPDVNRNLYVSPSGSDTSGRGSEDAPWRTIGFAISEGRSFALPNSPVTVYLAPGTYQEKVMLAPHVTVQGAGRGRSTIAYYDSEHPGEGVVVGAPSASLRDCTVTFSQEPGDIAVLLRIDRVVTQVQSVELDGQGWPMTFGALVTGQPSSGTAITDSLIRRVQFGLQAVNSGLTLARNSFEEITSLALYVQPPVGKSDVAFVAPILGDSERPDRTGLNRFRNVQGLLVQNNNPAEAMGEINDWGAYTTAEISAKLVGSVNYDHFLQKSLGPSSVAVAVKEGATGLDLPAATIAAVRMPLLNLDALHDASSNLYVFDAVPPGHQLIRGTVESMGTGETFVDVDGLGVKVAEIRLIAGDDGDGDGNGGGCSKLAVRTSAERRSAAFGNLWVGLGVVAALSGATLMRRRQR